MQRSTLLFFALALIFATTACSSQKDELPKKTQALLDDYGWRFEDLKASNFEEMEDATVHDRYYLVTEEADVVWEMYLESDPSLQWTGPIANFAGVYSPQNDEFYTASDSDVPGFAEGQIMFLDLVIEHMKHIPTAFMITEIDNDDFIFEFNYLESNPAKGKQQVSFYSIDSDTKFLTLIRHRSWFQNDSGLRDKLYPSYHEHAIDEFHTNIAHEYNYKLRVKSERRITKKGLVPEDLPL